MRKLVYLASLAMLAMLIMVPAALAQSRGPSGADGTFNCQDFDFQEDAQAVFDQDTSDPNGLDGPVGTASTGIPNVACEELPSRGTSTPPQQPMMEESMMEESMMEESMMEESMMEQPKMEQPKMEEKSKMKEMPKTGGPAIGSLLPVGALLVGAGVMAFTILRRK